MSRRSMSSDGRAKLIAREGFKTKAYRDSVGVWTIGVGHTAAAGAPVPRAGMVISKTEVDEILSRDLRQYEDAVSISVNVPLTQGQFDALVSFCFNIGTGGFKKSTVVKRLNAGNYRGAADAMLMWNKPPEIIGRRKSERAQFLAAMSAVRPAPAIVEAAPSPVADLPEEESISADYLRAAGSRTIAGADAIKGVAKTVLGADVVDGAARAGDALQQAQDAYAGFQHGAHWLELVKSYWPLVAGIVIAALIAYLAWRAIKAADKIAAARVDDAASGLHVGR
jgi:lysozyme